MRYHVDIVIPGDHPFIDFPEAINDFKVAAWGNLHVDAPIAQEDIQVRITQSGSRGEFSSVKVYS